MRTSDLNPKGSMLRSFNSGGIFHFYVQDTLGFEDVSQDFF